MCHGGALESGPRTGEVGGLKGEGPNPEKVGTPKGGCPKGGGPKISRFFFFRLLHLFSLFLSLSGCLLVEILVVFEAPGPSNVLVWSSWAVV